MFESLDGGRDVVPNSFSLDVLVYDQLAVRSLRIRVVIRHCMASGIKGVDDGWNNDCGWTFSAALDVGLRFTPAITLATRLSSSPDSFPGKMSAAFSAIAIRPIERRIEISGSGAASNSVSLGELKAAQPQAARAR